MLRPRPLVLAVGIPAILFYGSLVLLQARSGAALAEFSRLQEAHPPDSLHPVAAEISAKKMAALTRAARMSRSDPEPAYQTALLDLVVAEGRSLSPEDPPPIVGSGSDPKLAQLLQDGLRAVRKSIRLNPGAAEYHFLEALVLQNLVGVATKADSILGVENLVDACLGTSDGLDPFRPSLHFRLGSFQMALGNREAAKKAFAVALKDSYHNAQPIFDLLWSSLGDAQELSEFVGDEPLSRALLADFLWTRGYREEAEVEFGRARSNGPLDFRTGDLLIRHYFRTGAPLSARRLISEMQKRSDSWPAYQRARLRYLNGQSFLLENRYEDAVLALEEALRVDQNIYYVHEALAEVYYKVGAYDRAIARYRFLLGKTESTLPPPYAARLRVQLGQVYEKKKLFLEALGEYSKAVLLDPANRLAQRKALEISRDHL